MADITMCKDSECAARLNCYRYNAAPNQYMQSYFTKSPRNGDTCAEYWHNLDWQPEKRDRTIAQNGNSGEHYNELKEKENE